ncbi:hypothetical protein ABW19_dt0203171 [Dactylella cylindrospora]|nr:hypothetical protein ABW19_dt0203171 [Dactylella cylindrospora]
MSFFKALRGKSSPGKPKKSKNDAPAAEAPKAPVYQDPWERGEISADEICELHKACVIEIKSRGLTSPFFILPFRPTTDPSSGRTVVRKYFSKELDYQGPMRGDRLARELQLTDLNALCSVVKWCWARLPGGVVSWDTYELFRTGEADSEMSRNAFPTFIPMSVDSEARSTIIFDFFDLLSAIAANAKHNGLTGLKVSRMAGWWAFEHSDTGFGFEGGYQQYMRAAEATCHMFFAYLRSLAPSGKGTGVSVLPLSLQQLLFDTEYPPTASLFLREPTSRIIMTVDTVSPTPQALLRRTQNFDFTDEHPALQEFSEYEDPFQALTDESKRILKCISASNQSQKPGAAAGLGDQSWTRFQDLGFSLLDDEETSGDEDSIFGTTSTQSFRKRREVLNKPIQKQKPIDLARPTTPSWADFMASGFSEATTEARSPPPMLLSPDKLLPAIETGRARSVQSNRRPDEIHLEPGELASITTLMLDDAFWMVWITSLAPEETAARKAVFGRCAMFDTNIRGIKWVIIEEKVKGALKKANDDEIFLASKKDKKRTMRGKLVRRRSVDKKEPAPEQRSNGLSAPSLSKKPLTISPEQQANIRNTAATLRQRHDLSVARPRPNPPDRPAEKVMTNASIMTLQPTIMKEASPAMTWAKNYDKAAIREAYLAGATSMTSINASQKTLPPAPAENGDIHSYNPTPSRTPVRRESPPPSQNLVIPSPKPALLPQEPAKPLVQEELVSQASLDIVSPKPQPPVPVEPEHHEPPAPLAKVVSRTDTSERALSPEPEDGEASKKVSKLRKLFGGGKAGNRRASVQAPPRNLTVPDPKSERRPSLRGKPTFTNGNSVPEASVAEPTFEPAQALRQSPPATPKPIATRETTPAPSIVEEATAKKEFSRFDQGPLDLPAFVPEDSPEPPPIRPNHSSSKLAASREHIPDISTADNRYDISPPSEKADEPVPQPAATSAAQPASPSSPPLEPVQDRWAQIKANAAARAKANQAATAEQSRGAHNPPPPSEGEESLKKQRSEFYARLEGVNNDFMFPSTVVERFDNRMFVPDPKAKYTGNEKLVRNENFDNVPSYTFFERCRMIITPRPKLPRTYTTTYHFYSQFDEDTNRDDFDELYPSGLGPTSPQTATCTLGLGTPNGRSSTSDTEDPPITPTDPDSQSDPGILPTNAEANSDPAEDRELPRKKHVFGRLPRCGPDGSPWWDEEYDPGEYPHSSRFRDDAVLHLAFSYRED